MESYDKYVQVSENGTSAVLGEFKKILPRLSGKKILDIGCSTGLLCEHYLAENEVFGLDGNLKSVKIASGKGLKAKIHDLEKPLAFDSNFFDLVVCKDVLEFINNSEQLVQEMIRVTKRGGKILLHVPNEFAFPDIISLFMGKGILKRRWYAKSNELNNPHIRFFTKNGLGQELQEQGLVVEDYSHKWAFSIPLLKIKIYALSRIVPHLFSPGITLLCTKK